MSAQENEKAAVRTTIVGGRPPGSGRSNMTVPRGIEVLVKKAAVDPEFRELLFAQRDAAAAAIELELDPAESAMLNAIPREQLAQIVSQTVVPVEQRRVFLGRIAAAILAVLGASLVGCDEPVAEPAGIGPDRPPTKTNAPPPAPAGIQSEPAATRGIQPDRPESTPTNAPLPAPAGIQRDPLLNDSVVFPASSKRPTNELRVTDDIRPDRP